MMRAALTGSRVSRRTGRWIALGACLAALASGCAGDTAEDAPTAAAPTDPAESPDRLTGTSWQLVEFQPAGAPPEVPADPSVYTMDLAAGGRVTLRLDCNRATGTWTTAPDDEDPTTGEFEFGPLAATGALCPPGGMGEQVARQAAFVRSYRLEDDRLLLDLMSDGGTYVWVAGRPDTGASAP